jgi:hypothetical protein
MVQPNEAAPWIVRQPDLDFPDPIGEEALRVASVRAFGSRLLGRIRETKTEGETGRHRVTPWELRKAPDHRNVELEQILAAKTIDQLTFELEVE